MPNCRECNLSEGIPTKMYCTADIPWVIAYAYGPGPVDISIPATMEWMEHECPCFEPMDPSLPDGTPLPPSENTKLNQAALSRDDALRIARRFRRTRQGQSVYQTMSKGAIDIATLNVLESIALLAELVATALGDNLRPSGLQAGGLEGPA